LKQVNVLTSYYRRGHFIIFRINHLMFMERYSLR